MRRLLLLLYAQQAGLKRLDCKNDGGFILQQLPEGLISHAQTPVFDETSVPKGLLEEHTTAKAVWGLIRIIEGSLVYRILEPEIEEHTLNQADLGVIEPQVVHQVELCGPVNFFVEFYRC